MPLFPNSIYIVLFELDPINNVNRYVSDFLSSAKLDVDVEAALDATLDECFPSRGYNLSCYRCRKKINGPLQARILLKQWHAALEDGSCGPVCLSSAPNNGQAASRLRD